VSRTREPPTGSAIGDTSSASAGSESPPHPIGVPARRMAVSHARDSAFGIRSRSTQADAGARAVHSRSASGSDASSLRAADGARSGRSDANRSQPSSSSTIARSTHSTVVRIRAAGGAASGISAGR
jgi:hypothetical protein